MANCRGELSSYNFGQRNFRGTTNGFNENRHERTQCVSHRHGYGFAQYRQLADGRLLAPARGNTVQRAAGQGRHICRQRRPRQFHSAHHRRIHQRADSHAVQRAAAARRLPQDGIADRHDAGRGQHQHHAGDAVLLQRHRGTQHRSLLSHHAPTGDDAGAESGQPFPHPVQTGGVAV